MSSLKRCKQKLFTYLPKYFRALSLFFKVGLVGENWRVSHVVLVLVAVVSAVGVPVFELVFVVDAAVVVVASDGQNVKMLPRLIEGLVKLAYLSS